MKERETDRQREEGTLTNVETKCQGHAREIARNCDLEQVDGVVIISGDGMVSETANNSERTHGNNEQLHEVVNGLFERFNGPDSMLFQRVNQGTVS